MKKAIIVFLACLASLSILAGCGSGDAIHVITCDEGSGTRGVFAELLGMERIIEVAEDAEDTSAMLHAVANNSSAIGYISMGSLNDTVKALAIDGAAPNAESLRDGSYPITRPFQIVTKQYLSKQAKAFYDFILSVEGQAVVEAFGCVPREHAAPYEVNDAAGKVVVAGSSSVSPLMDKLIDAFAEVNKNINVELQQSDSTTGVSNTLEGLCDIGMISRDLKAEEEAKKIVAKTIGIDGIAIIASPKNKVNSLTKEQVRDIYIGEITEWAQIKP